MVRGTIPMRPGLAEDVGALFSYRFACVMMLHTRTRQQTHLHCMQRSGISAKPTNLEQAPIVAVQSLPRVMGFPAVDQLEWTQKNLDLDLLRLVYRSINRSSGSSSNNSSSISSDSSSSSSNFRGIDRPTYVDQPESSTKQIAAPPSAAR